MTTITFLWQICNSQSNAIVSVAYLTLLSIKSFIKRGPDPFCLKEVHEYMKVEFIIYSVENHVFNWTLLQDDDIHVNSLKVYVLMCLDVYFARDRSESKSMDTDVGIHC